MGYHLYKVNQIHIPNSIKVALTIGHWAFGHTEQYDDLRERPQNNTFPVPNYQYPKQSLLNQLYCDQIWPLLTGDRINQGFFYKKMYGRFAGRLKRSGGNNEMTVLTRWS